MMVCPSRDKWRKDCLTALAKFLDDGEWRAPVEVKELVLEGVKATFEGSTQGLGAIRSTGT